MTYVVSGAHLLFEPDRTDPHFGGSLVQPQAAVTPRLSRTRQIPFEYASA